MKTSENFKPSKSHSLKTSILLQRKFLAINPKESKINFHDDPTQSKF